MTDNTKTIPNALPVGRDQAEAVITTERQMMDAAYGLALKQTANNRKLD
jgi:hypothetical protein